MGIPTSEVGYTSATTGMGDHEVHKGHVVASEKKKVKSDDGIDLIRRELRCSGLLLTE
jgi:hypothetical protein